MLVCQKYLLAGEAVLYQARSLAPFLRAQGISCPVSSHFISSGGDVAIFSMLGIATDCLA